MHTWTTFFFARNVDSSSTAIVWESFKLHACMVLTSRINQFKAKTAAHLNKALGDLSTSEQSYIADLSPSKADLLKLQIRVVD